MKVLISIIVMAVVTYIPRVFPLVVFRRPINNVYIRSFLHYVPYAVLSALTFPSILWSTCCGYAYCNSSGVFRAESGGRGRGGDSRGLCRGRSDLTAKTVWNRFTALTARIYREFNLSLNNRKRTVRKAGFDFPSSDFKSDFQWRYTVQTFQSFHLSYILTFPDGYFLLISHSLQLHIHESDLP